MAQRSPFEPLLTGSRIQCRVPRRTLAPHPAHERGTLTGSFHFANSTEHSPWSACAFVDYLCTVSLPSPSGPSPCMWFSHTQTPMPHLTACRALDIAVRVSPAYVPLSFPSLAGSPVFALKDSNKMIEGACCLLSRPRFAASQS